MINVSSSLMKSGKIKLDSPDEFVVHGRQGDGLSYAPNGYLDSKLCGYLYMAVRTKRSSARSRSCKSCSFSSAPKVNIV